MVLIKRTLSIHFTFSFCERVLWDENSMNIWCKHLKPDGYLKATIKWCSINKNSLHEMNVPKQILQLWSQASSSYFF